MKAKVTEVYKVHRGIHEAASTGSLTTRILTCSPGATTPFISAISWAISEARSSNPSRVGASLLIGISGKDPPDFRLSVPVRDHSELLHRRALLRAASTVLCNTDGVNDAMRCAVGVVSDPDDPRVCPSPADGSLWSPGGAGSAPNL